MSNRFFAYPTAFSAVAFPVYQVDPVYPASAGVAASGGCPASAGVVGYTPVDKDRTSEYKALHQSADCKCQQADSP